MCKNHALYRGILRVSMVVGLYLMGVVDMTQHLSSIAGLLLGVVRSLVEPPVLQAAIKGLGVCAHELNIMDWKMIMEGFVAL